MPIARKRPYETHFYCALCGGPFAGVLRTPVNPTCSPYGTQDSELNDGTKTTSNNDKNVYYEDSVNAADLDRHSEFNFAGEENLIIPDEVVEQDMGYVARRSRKLRKIAEEQGLRRGVMNEQRTVRQAYDGRRISVKQMKWTKGLRALIHHKALNQPLNWRRILQHGEVYLTGRGLVRQSENWADAFASFDDDDDDPADEYPVFSESARLKNTYGFHLYREVDGRHLKSLISSIPFHDECYTLLYLAIEETGNEQGLERMNENLEEDHIWGYFRTLITASGHKPQVEQTRAILQAGTRKEVTTRFGEIDYREAQSSGEGWHWKHEDGCHWLAADPSEISFIRDNPLKYLPNTDPLPCAPRPATVDPFMNIPIETILEISGYLSSSDIFCFKMASPAVLHVALPGGFYRRFLKEEFKYLLKLRPEVEKHEDLIRSGIPCPIDWRGSFERLRWLTRTPRLSGNPDDEDYGKEWDEVDICLKNRSRIWKIVKPIAETLVETSGYKIRKLHGAHAGSIRRTGVVRGYVGVRLSKEGTAHTAYVGKRGRPNGQFNPDDPEEELEDIIQVKVEKIRLWCDKKTFCGAEFFVRDEEQHKLRTTMFGRPGNEHYDAPVGGKELAGFGFCFSEGIVCGVQVFYRDEFVKGETTFSKRVGRWDGSIRKITVPPNWRIFVGLTGFLNSAGFIETVGILEENGLGSEEEGFGRLREPPRTVTLSHDESSLWRKSLPPSNVEMHEREGAEVADWRLCGSEWEIWQPGFDEDGVKHDKLASSARLERITGYYDERFLRGLEFTYINRNRHRRTSLIGSKGKCYRDSCLDLEDGESIIASVINFSDEGVHGILFATDRRKVSEVFGPRYLGTHKVFAPPPDGHRSGTEHREEISRNIFGVHGLYDYEENRFLQLGLVLPLEEGFLIFPQFLTYPIPFDEKDELLGVWDDGPPPSDWIIGTSPTFVEADASYRLQHRRPFSDYSGWAKLDSLCQITFYRNMRGIRFRYGDEGKDKFFGDVEDEEGAVIQRLDYKRGERIVGVAVLEDEEVQPVKAVVPDNENDYISIISASSRYDEKCTAMEKIFFITNKNEGRIPFPVKRKIKSPEHLQAVKFDFNFDQLISWAPIFATNPSVPGAVSQRELTKLVRFPWKAHPDYEEISEDRNISELAYVTSTFFEANEAGRIDGFKGYVTRHGRFCGLLLRRNGHWMEQAFGERSAYETEFDLHEGESIDSIFVPEADGKLMANAVALSTNHGRTSPWIGKVEDGVTANHRKAPPGSVCVGIFGAQQEKPLLYSGPQWDMVGILYRPKSTNSPVPAPLPSSHMQPQPSIYHQIDPATGLRWLNNSPNPDPKLQVVPLLGHNSYRGNLEDVGRAISVFEPSKLLQVRVWCSGMGVCSIRFRGTADVGIITIGDWPDAEEINLGSDKKMFINGPGGERILRVKVAFQRLESEERVIGLCIETSHGREKTILSPEMSPERPIALGDGDVKVLECCGMDEIVGLHGILGPYVIHDMGLVLRMKTSCPVS